jgi:hypothetical protein
MNHSINITYFSDKLQYCKLNKKQVFFTEPLANNLSYLTCLSLSFMLAFISSIHSFFSTSSSEKNDQIATLYSGKRHSLNYLFVLHINNIVTLKIFIKMELSIPFLCFSNFFLLNQKSKRYLSPLVLLNSDGGSNSTKTCLYLLCSDSRFRTLP